MVDLCPPSLYFTFPSWKLVPCFVPPHIEPNASCSAALVEQLDIPPIRLGCGDPVLLAELPNLQPALLTQITADAGNVSLLAPPYLHSFIEVWELE
jgi:hypothetical protein